VSADAAEPGKLVRAITTPVRMEYRYTPGSASQKFLRALAHGRIVGQRCPSCRKVYVPPRGACPRCGVPTEENVELADKGTVVTFSIVRVPSENIKVELPYTAAHVLLDGADIAFQALIQECSLDRVRMGMRVQAVWKPRAEWGTTFENIRHFKPIDEPDVPYEKFKEHA
jgi:uncharacterized OB-fold protein